MLPGLMGLKIGSLVCTKSGCGRTRSIISWSLGLRGLARREGAMTLGLGLEVRVPSTSPTGPGFTCLGFRSFSSRLSSNESMVSSKNWRHSCSSWLRNCRASSSCQGQEKLVNMFFSNIGCAEQCELRTPCIIHQTFFAILPSSGSEVVSSSLI